MRVVAFDYGKVRIGVAITDELGILAHPRPTIDGTSLPRALNQIAELVTEEHIELILVGLPLDQHGQEGPAAERVRAFGNSIAQRTALPVEFIDERWSTVAANRRLREGGIDARKARSRIDSASACLMLQAWMDARSGGQE